ncbi:unnamed protein product [Symbiodinium natans]|uniref:Uncharacterized protein n=1 Tax=Symbiodinium natans TaxID=878477 RepID=A0A812UWC4_9DINO|nr:unnamed protein product [Symbiodinium natans]
MDAQLALRGKRQQAPQAQPRGMLGPSVEKFYLEGVDTSTSTLKRKHYRMPREEVKMPIVANMVIDSEQGKVALALQAVRSDGFSACSGEYEGEYAGTISMLGSMNLESCNSANGQTYTIQGLLPVQVAYGVSVTLEIRRISEGRVQERFCLMLKVAS